MSQESVCVLIDLYLPSKQLFQIEALFFSVKQSCVNAIEHSRYGTEHTPPARCSYVQSYPSTDRPPNLSVTYSLFRDTHRHHLSTNGGTFLRSPCGLGALMCRTHAKLTFFNLISRVCPGPWGVFRKGFLCVIDRYDHTSLQRRRVLYAQRRAAASQRHIMQRLTK